jgi:hypothetical protein
LEGRAFVALILRRIMTQLTNAATEGHSPSSGMRPLSQFAADLGKTPSTVWRWRKLGMLDVVNICGKLYVSDEAIQKFKTRAAAGEFSRKPVVPVRTKGAEA